MMGPLAAAPAGQPDAEERRGVSLLESIRYLSPGARKALEDSECGSYLLQQARVYSALEDAIEILLCPALSPWDDSGARKRKPAAGDNQGSPRHGASGAAGGPWGAPAFGVSPPRRRESSPPQAQAPRRGSPLRAGAGRSPLRQRAALRPLGVAELSVFSRTGEAAGAPGDPPTESQRQAELQSSRTPSVLPAIPGVSGVSAIPAVPAIPILPQ